MYIKAGAYRFPVDRAAVLALETVCGLLNDDNLKGDIPPTLEPGSKERCVSLSLIRGEGPIGLRGGSPF